MNMDELEAAIKGSLNTNCHGKLYLTKAQDTPGSQDVAKNRLSSQ